MRLIEKMIVFMQHILKILKHYCIVMQKMENCKEDSKIELTDLECLEER